MTATIASKDVKVTMYVNPKHLDRFLDQAKKSGVNVVEIETGNREVKG